MSKQLHPICLLSLFSLTLAVALLPPLVPAGENQRIARDSVVDVTGGDSSGVTESRPAGLFARPPVDLDGDGRIDLVRAVGSPARLELLFDRGRGGYDVVVAETLDAAVVDLILSDVDGDGREDLAVLELDPAELRVYRNDGQGQLPLWSRQLVGGLASSLAVTDLDGDGDRDFVVGHLDPDGFTVLDNDGEGRLAVVETLPNRPGEVLAPSFHRGDVNDDSTLDIGDPVYLLEILFFGEPGPACEDAADADDDGTLHLSDALFILHHLYRGVGQIPAPGPPARPCGADPVEPVEDDLSCEVYESC